MLFFTVFVYIYVVKRQSKLYGVPPYSPGSEPNISNIDALIHGYA